MQKDGMTSKFSDGDWRSNFEPRARAAARVPAERSVQITQQFRGRLNMTYELDCCGVPLVLRVFFPEDAGDRNWRIEACASDRDPALQMSASAASKAQALRDIAQNWRETMPTPLSNLDWNGIAQAMTSVRAI